MGSLTDVDLRPTYVTCSALSGAQHVRRTPDAQRGDIARRTNLGGELPRPSEREREDSDAAVHGAIVNTEELRFQRPRRGTRST